MADVVKELQPLFDRTKLYKAALHAWLLNPSSNVLVEAYRKNPDITDEEIYEIVVTEFVKFFPINRENRKPQGYDSLRNVAVKFSESLYGDREYWKKFLPSQD